MKSIYNGNGIGGIKYHLIQYYDGYRIKEISVNTLFGRISWTEKTIPNALEVGLKYTNAKKRLLRLEKRNTMRIG